MDTAGLTALWVGAWGDCRPVSYELRSCLHDRWVRFHSLPGSKRYAGSEQEYAELIRRHLVVLAELLSHGGADQARELVVVTASWPDAPRPAPRAAELAGALPAATYWTSVLTDDSIPDAETWTHLWASCRPPARRGTAPATAPGRRLRDWWRHHHDGRDGLALPPL